MAKMSTRNHVTSFTTQAQSKKMKTVGNNHVVKKTLTITQAKSKKITSPVKNLGAKKICSTVEAKNKKIKPSVKDPVAEKTHTVTQAKNKKMKTPINALASKNTCTSIKGKNNKRNAHVKKSVTKKPSTFVQAKSQKVKAPVKKSVAKKTCSATQTEKKKSTGKSLVKKPVPSKQAHTIAQTKSRKPKAPNKNPVSGKMCSTTQAKKKKIVAKTSPSSQVKVMITAPVNLPVVDKTSSSSQAESKKLKAVKNPNAITRHTSIQAKKKTSHSSKKPGVEKKCPVVQPSKKRKVSDSVDAQKYKKSKVSKLASSIGSRSKKDVVTEKNCISVQTKRKMNEDAETSQHCKKKKVSSFSGGKIEEVKISVANRCTLKKCSVVLTDLNALKNCSVVIDKIKQKSDNEENAKKPKEQKLCRSVSDKLNLTKKNVVSPVTENTHDIIQPKNKQVMRESVENDQQLDDQEESSLSISRENEMSRENVIENTLPHLVSGDTVQVVGDDESTPCIVQASIVTTGESVENDLACEERKEIEWKEEFLHDNPGFIASSVPNREWCQEVIVPILTYSPVINQKIFSRLEVMTKLKKDKVLLDKRIETYFRRKRNSPNTQRKGLSSTSHEAKLKRDKELLARQITFYFEISRDKFKGSSAPVKKEKDCEQQTFCELAEGSQTLAPLEEKVPLPCDISEECDKKDLEFILGPETTEYNEKKVFDCRRWKEYVEGEAAAHREKEAHVVADVVELKEEKDQDMGVVEY